MPFSGTSVLFPFRIQRLTFSSTPPLASQIKVMKMYVRESCRFARPFADVWQHLPFQPSASLSQFLDRFMIGGRFDAERFWEFVAAVSGQPSAFSQADAEPAEN